MRKDELVQSVRDYINNDKAKYAVLIDGVWGCGKTYLYENILKDEIVKLEVGKNERKHNIYISLYGISSVEQLAKELVTNYILESKFHGNKDKKNRFMKLKKATSIISKTVSFSINGININLDKGIEELEKTIQFGNMVICFDDFERCGIPVVDLFGIINNLVEHCNCKVLILADEDNIGKVYANTNIELKYISLLQNRKIVDKKNTQAEEIGIEEVKKLNQKVYSENYIYKDIKEKVIGLSLIYTPDLKEEFDSVVNNVVGDKKLIDKLIEKKTKILKYMDDCDNNNIRIVRSWLIKYEEIYKVLIKNFSNEKYIDEVLDRFAKYSIRVACAIGKNIALPSWDKNIEISYLYLIGSSRVEGYKFVDDLYKGSLVNSSRICLVAKQIINEKQNEERIKKQEKQESQKCRAYRKLKNWFYLEDDTIKQYVEVLKDEINNNEYNVQDYQRIISTLTDLVTHKLLNEELLKCVSDIMQDKIKETNEVIDIENFQYYFMEEKEASDLYNKYYDPINALIVEKNKEFRIRNINQTIDYSTGETFYNSCKNNYDEFISNRSFVAYIDFKKLYKIISTGEIKYIYNIENAFKKIYDFSNLNEYYSGDVEQLKELLKGLESLDCEGKTRNLAIDILINTINKKIGQIEQIEN